MNTPRPKQSDPQILRRAAELLAPEVMSWLGPENENPLEDIVEDLEHAMSWNRDGYEMAKAMDEYMPNAALVEILDAAGHHVASCHKKACEEWVKAEGLTPPEIGSHVRDTTKPDHGIGTIVRNSPEGRSTVSFPLLGHVTNGGLGTIGLVIEWEKLENA